MKNIILKDFIGHSYIHCQIFRCKNKAFKEYAGIVFCRKHWKNEMIKNYGSVKRALKYVK